MISFLAAPKPFRGSIAHIQMNAIRSWRALDKSVDVLLLGEEEGISSAASATGARWGGPIERNPSGTPLVSSLFERGRSLASQPILCYVNADIVLLEDFLPAIDRVRQGLGPFLVAGQRWDLDITGNLVFDLGWQARVREEVRLRGVRHPPVGSDYFVFRRDPAFAIPPFALGRSGWDNWMIFAARSRRWAVVDASSAITAVHQNHGYDHLPGGRSHHGHPESEENIRLGGGRRAMFTLRDANWRVEPPAILTRQTGPRRWLREAETFPLLRLGSRRLAEVVHWIFHPRRAWRRVRGWLAYRGSVAKRGGRRKA